MWPTDHMSRIPWCTHITRSSAKVVAVKLVTVQNIKNPKRPHTVRKLHSVLLCTSEQFTIRQSLKNPAHTPRQAESEESWGAEAGRV